MQSGARPSSATLERWRRSMSSARPSARPPQLLQRCSRRFGGGFGAAVAAASAAADGASAESRPPGYLPPRRRPAGRGGRGRAAPPPAPSPAADDAGAKAAECAAAAAAVALAASAATTAAVAPPSQHPSPAPPPAPAARRARRRSQAIPDKFRGLASDAGRPWQRAEIRRMLSATMAAAADKDEDKRDDDDDDDDGRSPPSLYDEFTAPRLKRVLDARVAIETDARRLLEEARWQRERADAWARLALARGSPAAADFDALPPPTTSAHALPDADNPRLLDFTARTALAEVADLSSECGAAEARLRALVDAAAACRDGPYARSHGPALLGGVLGRVRQFCAHYRAETAPALERVLEWSAVAASAAARGRDQHRPPGAAPPLPSTLPAGWLPPPLPRAEAAVEWRYPPSEYVVFRRKGERGARARAHPLPPAMRERAERQQAEASRRAAERALGDGGGRGGGAGGEGGGQEGGGGVFG